MPNINKHLQLASQQAQAAVAMDKQGNLKEALDLYIAAAGFLQQAMQDPTLQTADAQSSIRRSLDSYLSRAEQIKRQLNGTQEMFPQVPHGQLATRNYDGTVATRGPNDPSLLKVGYQAIKVVNSEGGKIALAGYMKAVEIDNKHDITGKIARGADATYKAALEADKKYHITENISTGVHTAFESAKEANEKHHITEKVVNVAAASATKLQELNNEYKVTETVGKTLLKGLNFASDKATGYLNSKKEEEGGHHRAIEQ